MKLTLEILFVLLLLVFIYSIYAAKKLSDESSGDSAMGLVFLLIYLAVSAVVGLLIVGVVALMVSI